MKLENIGFYTLEDKRAEGLSLTSPLWRCELLLTDRCNFKCPYCRGLGKDSEVEQTFESAKHIVDLWCDEGLKNVRFSGGEPTTWKWLNDLVSHARKRGVERIAVSTNGSKPFAEYERLLESGVNDFSISLDACCASTGDMMAGGIRGAWQRVVGNIRKIAQETYVTAGVVLTESNIAEAEKTIEFAYNLGVDDIRIISAAQWNNKEVFTKLKIKDEILIKCKILKYRVGNFKSDRNVRGITECDNNKCPLVIDDMAIKGNKHYPCIIHLREGGAPIGVVGRNMRQERYDYYLKHDTFKDEICRNNCLDVCVDYNNKVREVNKGGI